MPLFDKKPADGHGVDAWGNQCYCALRLASGKHADLDGNGHAVIEVTPDKKIVWHLAQSDLPGIKLAWVTTLQVLPSGNIVLGNCHAGEANPQVIEVTTRDKKSRLEVPRLDRFGDSFTNTQVLSVSGATLVSKPGSEAVGVLRNARAVLFNPPAQQGSLLTTQGLHARKRRAVLFNPPAQPRQCCGHTGPSCRPTQGCFV